MIIISLLFLSQSDFIWIHFFWQDCQIYMFSQIQNFMVILLYHTVTLRTNLSSQCFLEYKYSLVTLQCATERETYLPIRSNNYCTTKLEQLDNLVHNKTSFASLKTTVPSVPHLSISGSDTIWHKNHKKLKVKNMKGKQIWILINM